MPPYSLKNADGSATANLAAFKYGIPSPSKAFLKGSSEISTETNATGFYFKTGTSQLYALVSTEEVKWWVPATPIKTASDS